MPPPIFVEGRSIVELPPQIGTDFLLENRLKQYEFTNVSLFQRNLNLQQELNDERKENQSMRENFRRLTLKSQDPQIQNSHRHNLLLRKQSYNRLQISCLNPNKRRVVQEHLSNLVPFFEIQPLIERRHLQKLINLQLQLLDLHHRTPSDGRYRIDQDVTSWPTQLLNGEECPIDYMEFLAYGMVAAFSISEDFRELPFGEALNEEIRKQQKFGTVFVKVQSQIPYYRKGRYRQNFHHFLVTPLIEQTEEGLTEPQCDKFLQDARLYKSLGDKYAEDYNSLSFDIVVKKSCYQVWIPKDCECLSLIQAGVIDPNPEN
ncbi:hypothetical protein K1719_002827 [Acacia pycnantha]|nr:hypothetical protein K1719_002827 [Acacia pycnantha]